MSHASRFTVEQVDDVTILTLTDPLLQDTLIVTELQDAFLEFLNQRSPQRVAIDFRHVNHCSTAIINGLLQFKTRLRAADGELRLCEMVQGVADAFRTLRLHGSVFQIDDTREQAIAKLRGE